MERPVTAAGAAAWQSDPSLLLLLLLLLLPRCCIISSYEKINNEMHHSFTFTALTLSLLLEANTVAPSPGGRTLGNLLGSSGGTLVNFPGNCTFFSKIQRWFTLEHLLSGKFPLNRGLALEIAAQ